MAHAWDPNIIAERVKPETHWSLPTLVDKCVQLAALAAAIRCSGQAPMLACKPTGDTGCRALARTRCRRSNGVSTRLCPPPPLSLTAP